MKRVAEVIAKCSYREFKPVSAQVVAAAEQALGISFPDELKQYLLTFGALAVGSLAFYGLGVKEKSPRHIVKATEELRAEGLEHDAVALEYREDNYYTICRRDGTIVEWSPTYKKVNVLAAGLEDYLVARIEE